MPRGVIDINRQEGLFTEQIDRLGIRLQRITDSINTLSGGNQQKVVLAKWLAARPKVLILDNPPRG